MQYAIELYYDKEIEQKLFNLAKRVADVKLSTKFLELIMQRNRQFGV